MVSSLLPPSPFPTLLLETFLLKKIKRLYWLPFAVTSVLLQFNSVEQTNTPTNHIVHIVHRLQSNLNDGEYDQKDQKGMTVMLIMIHES